MEKEKILPEWLVNTTEYVAEADHDGFITKSILSLMGILSKARSDGAVKYNGSSAVIRIIYTLLFIVLMACSHNMFFTYIILAGTLAKACFVNSKYIKRILGGAITAFVLSAVLLLPAVFLGSPKTMLTVSIKVFTSVCLINILAATTPWNKITEAFRVFHIPDIFIFTFDITLKYIVILGDVCLNIVTAVKLRSVGKNNNKRNALSGILGLTFLKSREMSEEMYGAMVLRGFEGEYKRPKSGVFKKSDRIFLLLMAAVIVLFIYFEKVM